MAGRGDVDGAAMRGSSSAGGTYAAGRSPSGCSNSIIAPAHATSSSLLVSPPSSTSSVRRARRARSADSSLGASPGRIRPLAATRVSSAQTSKMTEPTSPRISSSIPTVDVKRAALPLRSMTNSLMERVPMPCGYSTPPRRIGLSRIVRPTRGAPRRCERRSRPISSTHIAPGGALPRAALRPRTARHRHSARRAERAHSPMEQSRDRAA